VSLHSDTEVITFASSVAWRGSTAYAQLRWATYLVQLGPVSHSEAADFVSRLRGELAEIDRLTVVNRALIGQHGGVVLEILSPNPEWALAQLPDLPDLLPI
jgi:hypothetical protein